MAAILKFRDTINVDDRFVRYKVLVGFESVYPGHWTDKEFDYKGPTNIGVGKLTATSTRSMRRTRKIGSISLRAARKPSRMTLPPFRFSAISSASWLSVSPK